MLVLAADSVASLSVQWGNMLLPMVVVWCFGSVIIHALGRFHITITYVLSFIGFALVRSLVTGHPFSSEVAPITGPMYQLFIFFMITDPKTTVRSFRGQCLVAFLVAAVEAGFRLTAVRAFAVLRALHRRTGGEPRGDGAGPAQAGCVGNGAGFRFLTRDLPQVNMARMSLCADAVCCSRQPAAYRTRSGLPPHDYRGFIAAGQLVRTVNRVASWLSGLRTRNR